MTAGGNTTRIDEAKNILRNAAIGLVIVLSAFGITSFIVSRFTSATGTGGTFSGDSSMLAPGGGFRGALGGGIVESHYPQRNATGIARNANIIISFREPMDVSTIATLGDENDPTDDTVNVEHVHIRRTIDSPPEQDDYLTDVAVRVDGEQKTFVFDPGSLLGSPSEDVSYTIRFESGLRKANGDAAFGQFGDFYEWQFTVSTFVDTTAPKVISVVPIANETFARNVLIQVNFDEPIDPTVVAGRESRSRVVVSDEGGARLGGTVRVGNMYQTLEFTTDPNGQCGVNSCGGVVYCLPASERIGVMVPTATLSSEAPRAEYTAQGYAGVVDLAGNALDGNGNDRAEGPGIDDYEWEFITDATIRLEPPHITTVVPARGAEDVAITSIPRATFSERLSVGNLGAVVGMSPSINHWPTVRDQNILEIRHDPYDINRAYTPVIRSGLTDIYQNCYAPCADEQVCTGSNWSQEYPSCPARL
jgi:hypothetical protein